MSPPSRPAPAAAADRPPRPGAGGPSLSVVIPCYNEVFRLQPLFHLIAAATPGEHEWLLVNDGSKDRTGQALAEFAAAQAGHVRALHHERNLGKGAAVRTGVLAARGELVGFVDADLAASPLDFAAYLDDADLRQGRTLLIGIRLLTQAKRVRRDPLRHALGRVYQTYVSQLTGLTVYDTQCGFKLVAADRARQLFEPLRCAGFAFDTELILRALAAGMTVREVTVAWEERGRSRVRPWSAARMFWDVLKLRRHLAHAREGR